MSKSTARYIILGLLVIVLFSITQLSALRFDYDFESLFSTDDPELVYYQSYRNKFGNDNDYLLLGFEPASGVFNSDFLTRITQLSEELAALPEVTLVSNPSEIQYPVKTPLSMVLVPYLHPDSDERLQRDSISLASEAGLMGLLISSDLKSIRLIIRHQPLDLEDGGILIKKIERILADQNFEKYYLAGKAKAQVVFVQSIQKDFQLFLGIGALLIMGVMWWIFRSAPLILVSVAVIGLVLAITLSGMALFKIPIDVMGALIPMILVIVSMSDIIHFSTRYQDELSHDQDTVKALTTAWKEVGQATLLTSVTTAIGFFTLLTASSKPISQMGIVTGSGVLIAFAITFTLLPAIITIWPDFIKSARRAKDTSSNSLAPGLAFVQHNGLRIKLTFGLITIAAIIGLARLEIDAKLISDLPEPSSIKTSFLFFEQEFGGSKPWELSIELQDTNSSVYDPAIISELSKLTNYISTTYGVSSLVSPLTPVMLYNKALTSQYEVPNLEAYNKWGGSWTVMRQKLVPESILAQNEQHARLSGFVPDYGSKTSQEKDQALEQFITDNIDSDLIDVRLTGTTYLIDRSHDFISKNLLSGLLIAILTIALILGVVYRKINLVLISLTCNLLPLLFIAGVLGWMNIPLSLSNAIIFAVSFGIAVDDTVHFLSKYNLEVMKGCNPVDAVANTLQSTGKAIIFTSLILVAGFSLFVFSSFQTTFSIGLLISLTLVFAVVIDLYLLPSLLLFKSKSAENR
ncbi:MAG: MMPL family transporter [Cyclobacteriaceae bacterium]